MPSGFPNNRPVFLRGPGGRFAQQNFGFYWQGLEVLANNINKRGTTLNESRKKVMDKMAKEMEAHMKINAPWRDRTTDAREGLRAVAVHGTNSSTISAGHTVRYGPALELMESGKFAIVEPTLLLFSRRMFSEIKEAQYNFGDEE